MNEMDFNSLDELKERVKPALDSKVSDLKICGYPDISREEIWDDLSKSKWKDSMNLSLSDMINDILKYNL
jgi:UTP-glucose-1-phosphate uridylyltransferase